MVQTMDADHAWTTMTSGQHNREELGGAFDWPAEVICELGATVQDDVAWQAMQVKDWSWADSLANVGFGSGI